MTDYTPDPADVALLRPVVLDAMSVPASLYCEHPGDEGPACPDCIAAAALSALAAAGKDFAAGVVAGRKRAAEALHLIPGSHVWALVAREPAGAVTGAAQTTTTREESP